ncbi:MAG: 5-(carboxyamino)imidazole ribonucleotide synthase [Burkholderiaceae bacterium]
MKHDAHPLAPGSWLGLLGGGQLGRMFCMAAQSMGFKVCVLDPAADGPAASVADRHIQGDYLDKEKLRELGQLCAACTTEFENVPAQSLAFLREHCIVSPAPEAVAIAQDRIDEKAFAQRCGLEVAPYAPILGRADIDGLADESLFPGILKAARLGYDGKGQASVANRAELHDAFLQFGGVPCVLEKRMDLEHELSVVVARAFAGETVAYPVAENVHRGGILAVSAVPARIDPALALRATEATVRMAHTLEYVGVLCVEFFILADDTMLVNEMAPRPHNSGHYTIDACVTSQFEQQARVLAGWPLGGVQQHEPAVMLNLLGDLWFEGASQVAREPDWLQVVKHPRAKLHLYGKREARPGRKMGHVTVLGDSLDQAQGLVRRIEADLDRPVGAS